jgi:hypothetical protein
MCLKAFGGGRNKGVIAKRKRNVHGNNQVSTNVKPERLITVLCVDKKMKSQKGDVI